MRRPLVARRVHRGHGVGLLAVALARVHRAVGHNHGLVARATGAALRGRCASGHAAGAGTRRLPDGWNVQQDAPVDPYAHRIPMTSPTSVICALHPLLAPPG
jgi:hypothetical protein